MNDTYLFIIWNKALWCKDKICNDIDDSFEIVYQTFIEWDDDKYENNLMSLYGRKLGPVEDKIRPCGKGKFYFILVKDNNPKFDQRELYDGKGIVNAKIYDKKMLYRKWTAGSHRIHCSDDNKETSHDIAVLFGNDFNINNKNEIIKLNTKGVAGFNSIQDLLNCLKLFGDNYTILNEENIIFIFAKCKYDIVAYIKCSIISKNLYSIKIKNETFNLYIFGELDGDLPIGFIDKLANNLNLSKIIIDNCNTFINNKNNVDIINYLKNNNIESKYYNNFECRTEKKSNIKIIKSELKLFLKKIKYFFIFY